HSGTYNGHPMVLKAGLETIRLLEEKHVLDILFSHTMLLRNRLETLYASYQIDMQTIGMGSIFNLVFTKEPVHNYRDMWKANTVLRKDIDIELLNLGIYLKPLHRYSISIAPSLDDIRYTVIGHDLVLQCVFL